MSKPVAIMAVLTAAALASGCSTLQRSMGQGKIVPDEFRVVTSAPLTLPPEYSLRPPRPGRRAHKSLSPAPIAALLARTPAKRQRRSVNCQQCRRSAVDPNTRDVID